MNVFFHPIVDGRLRCPRIFRRTQRTVRETKQVMFSGNHPRIISHLDGKTVALIFRVAERRVDVMDRVYGRPPMMNQTFHSFIKINWIILRIGTIRKLDFLIRRKVN